MSCHGEKTLSELLKLLAKKTQRERKKQIKSEKFKNDFIKKILGGV